MRTLGEILNDRREASGKHAATIDYEARKAESRERLARIPGEAREARQAAREARAGAGGPPRPPRAPWGPRVSIEGDALHAQGGGAALTARLDSVRLDLLDQTGSRLTLTRAAVIGLFALGAKKKTGHISIVVTDLDSGRCVVLKYRPGAVAKAMVEWATRFAAWQAAAQS